MGAGIKDVARRAGVSIASVSRVLSNQPYVSETLRQKVTAAARELDYQPSRVARTLRKQRAGVLGLIISDIQNPFFTSLVRAVEDVAYEHGYAILLCNSDEDLEKEKLYVGLLVSERVAGIVICPTCEASAACHHLATMDVPLVCVDRRLAGGQTDTVRIDNVGAAFRLASHLIEDGHRRIAGLFGSETMTTGRERQEGYVQALETHGLPVLPKLIRSGPPKEYSGFVLTSELLDLPEPPDAILAGNNLLSVGALRAIRQRKLEIPGDIALASFDEMDWMPLLEPGLTAVVQPTYELGRLAATLLLDRIEDEGRPVRDVVLKPALIVRGSCAHHPAESSLDDQPETPLLAGER